MQIACGTVFEASEYRIRAVGVAVVPRAMEDESVQEGASRRQSKALTEECYYHGLLPREDVHHLLKNNGDFLVRTSQPAPDQEREIILSLLTDKAGMRHILVRKQNGTYQIDDSKRFASVPELVDHFFQSGKPPLPNISNTALVTAVPRQKWELSHSYIELTKRLGEGQFGEVYRGRLKKKKKTVDVAVKQAKVSAMSKEQIKEVMREARLMRNFHHANVVRIYGVALDEDPLMIVMELVRGGCLQTYLQRSAGRLTDVERINCMVSGAAWGLEYLHSKCCIHRDIAARNCLYDKHKNIKISDFGLSREGPVYKMTVTRRIPIKWIAPEALVSFTFTPASDVFSFGVMVWEIFTNGAEPFEGKKTAEIKSLLCDGYRHDFPLCTPNDIKELVTQHCWNQKPGDRYTMGEIVTRLEQISAVKQPKPKKKERNKGVTTVDDQDEVSMEIGRKRDVWNESTMTAAQTPPAGTPGRKTRSGSKYQAMSFSHSTTSSAHSSFMTK